MSQQTYTAIQVSIICLLVFLIAVVAVLKHPGWFDSAVPGAAVVASTGYRLSSHEGPPSAPRAAKTPVSAHSRESRNPEAAAKTWVPAYQGMSGL